MQQNSAGTDGLQEFCLILFFLVFFSPFPSIVLTAVSFSFKNVILSKQLTQNTWSGGVS